jgi:undecaprenyl-diphosphatase
MKTLKINKVIGIILFSCFLIILSYNYFDLKIIQLIHSRLSPQWYQIGDIGSYLGYGFIIIPLVFVFSLLSYFIPPIKEKSLPFLTTTMFAFITSGLITIIIKYLTGRARPSSYLVHHLYGFYGYTLKNSFHSFPSGHVTTATVVFGVLALYFKKTRYISAIIVILVAASRILADSHYLSDTMAGALIGILTVMFCAKKIEWFKSPKIYTTIHNVTNQFKQIIVSTSRKLLNKVLCQVT